MATLGDLYRQILSVLGDEPASDLSEFDIASTACDWFSSAHTWNFLRRSGFLDLRASIQSAEMASVMGIDPARITVVPSGIDKSV